MRGARRIVVWSFTVIGLLTTTAFERVAVALEASAPPPPGSAWERAETVGRERRMYAIVDSIAFWAPFNGVAAAYGAGVHVRGGFGWTTHAHANERWGQSQRSSFQDAAASSASMLFVGLGTNDIACMRAGELCGDAFPRTEEERAAERARWFAEVNGAAALLVSAGKCVAWAGPREIESATSSIEEPRSFNQMLRDLEVRYSGSFYYVDYHRFSFEDPDVLAALDGPSGDRIHPYTRAASRAIARFAVESTVSRCSVEQAAPEGCDGAAPRQSSSPVAPLMPSAVAAFWLWRRGQAKRKKKPEPCGARSRASSLGD